MTHFSTTLINQIVKELQEKWALCVCTLRGKWEAAVRKLQEVFSIHKVRQFNRINNLLFIIRKLTSPIEERFFCNWNLFRLSLNTEKSKLSLARCTEKKGRVLENMWKKVVSAIYKGKRQRGYRTIVTSNSQDQASHKHHMSRAALLTEMWTPLIPGSV